MFERVSYPEVQIGCHAESPHLATLSLRRNNLDFAFIAQPSFITDNNKTGRARYDR